MIFQTFQILESLLYRIWKRLFKVAVNTIVPRSPFFAFCTPKYRLLPVFMVTKSCTKILNFSTRFSCQHFAAEDFLTLFIGEKLVDGEMLCSMRGRYKT